MGYTASMIYLLTLISAITSYAGNVFGKLWADTNNAIWLVLMFAVYAVAAGAYALSLKLGGGFTFVNALFYAFVPVVTALTGVLLFKDRLTTLQMAGLFLGFASIFFFTIEKTIITPR